MSVSRNNIWYVRFPVFRYVEDVEVLAKNAGLRIIDARFDAGDGVKVVPALTLKPEYRKPEPKPEPVEVDESGDGETDQSNDGQGDAQDDEKVDLYSVVKVVDGLRSERASRVNLPLDEAQAWVAGRPDNVYEIVPESE